MNNVAQLNLLHTQKRNEMAFMKREKKTKNALTKVALKVNNISYNATIIHKTVTQNYVTQTFSIL